MLTMYQLKVDDLQPDEAFEIAGGPNPDRPALAARLFAEGAYEPVAMMIGPGVSWALETLYAGTQNKQHSVKWWSLDPPIGIVPIKPVAFFDGGRKSGRRSSMAGDIIESDSPPARWVVDWMQCEGGLSTQFRVVPKP